MEAAYEQKTDYELVAEYMQHLLTLNSSQLITFYCQSCHERLATPLECRPAAPFQENTGACLACKRCNDVSNPHITRFLNERGLLLEYPSTPGYTSRRIADETTLLIRDWLIPNDYGMMGSIDPPLDPAVSWLNYGRRQEQQLHRCTSIHPESKALLLPFYPLCYSLDRFTSEPVKEPAAKESTEAARSLADESILAVKEYCDQQSRRRLVWLTFEPVKLFVTNIRQRWKGKRNEKGT